MKIIMIANGMDIGGAETHILELSAALCEKGHSVTVASPIGAYTKELRRKGIRTVRMPRFDGTVRSFYAQMKKLFSLCRQVKPDVLHAHTRPGILQSVWIGKIMSIPVVATAHLPFQKETFFERRTQWGDTVLAVSEDIKKHLMLHYAVPDKNIEIIRNGIDTDRFRPKGNVDQTIVHISRLDGDRSKTAELLIALAPKLAKQKLCQRITIVGDGENFQKLQEKSHRVNRKIGNEYVQMTGAKTDIEKILVNRPVFVGVSRAALEAMACECPTILCGNEGYDGILSEAKARKAMKTNFCCRNHRKPTKENLFHDLTILFNQTEKERLTIGRCLRNTVIRTFSTKSMAEVAEASYKMAIRKKTSGIMLCGYYGYGNPGDEAVLPMIIKKCSRHFDRITVMSRTPQKDQKKYGVPCINRFSIFTFLRSFRCKDILVLGGGNLLQNQTSHRSLVYYLFISTVAKMKKGKIAIVRGGIGELHGLLAQKATNLFLKNCDYITCRTPGDLTECQKSGGFPKSKFASDGSLYLPFSIQKEHFPLSLSRPYCVIVLKGAAKKEIFAKTRKIGSFCQVHHLVPVFLVFDEHEDRKTAKTAAALLSGSTVINAKKHETIEQVILGSQAVLTDRLHAAYFALIANRPFSFLEQTEKNLRHLQYMKTCFQKANAYPILLCDLPDKERGIPSPLSKGNHARLLAVLIKGGKERL